MKHTFQELNVRWRLGYFHIDVTTIHNRDQVRKGFFGSWFYRFSVYLGGQDMVVRAHGRDCSQQTRRVGKPAHDLCKRLSNCCHLASRGPAISVFLESTVSLAVTSLLNHVRSTALASQTKGISSAPSVGSLGDEGHRWQGSRGGYTASDTLLARPAWNPCHSQGWESPQAGLSSTAT